MKSPTRNCIPLGSKNKSLSREKTKQNSKNHQSRQSQFIQNCSQSRTMQNSFYQSQKSAIYDFDQDNSRIYYETVNFHSPEASRILKANHNINRSSPFSKQKKIVRFYQQDKHHEFSPVNKLNQIKIASNLSMNSHLKQNKISNTELTQISTQRQGQLVKKLKIVQGRLQNLMKQKQVMVQQNIKLFHQNQFLKKRLKEVQLQESQRIKIKQLQQMLQTQINKSLQLMDHVQIQTAKICQMQEQNKSLNLLAQTKQVKLLLFQTQIFQLKTQIQRLKLQINTLKEKFQNQVQEIEENNNQIKLQFTNQTVNLQNLLTQAEKEKQELKIKLKENSQSFQKFQKTTRFQKQEIELLKKQLQLNCQINKNNSLQNSSNQHFTKKSLQSKQQCKKCQQLLKTVFKLNSHLNKEGGKQ